MQSAQRPKIFFFFVKDDYFFFKKKLIIFDFKNQDLSGVVFMNQDFSGDGRHPDHLNSHQY